MNLLIGEQILPVQTANQYLARYWFAVCTGKIGARYWFAVCTGKIGSPIRRFISCLYGMLEVPVPDMSRETIYDDEPKTEKEIEANYNVTERLKPMHRSAHTRRPVSGEAIEVPYRHTHKECAEIRKAAWKEIQQLIEMSVGVLLDERQADAAERDKIQRCRSCGARWCASANMRFRQLMGKNTS
jgi:hypothetical protein